MGFLVILSFGLATAANLAVLKFKLEHYRYVDAAIDAAVLIILAWIFSGSIAGLAIATVASSFVSLYLLVSSPDTLVERVFGKKKKKKKKRKKNAKSTRTKRTIFSNK